MLNTPKTTPKFISLFCGCGGFDFGFHQAGFECLGAYDIDPIAISVHKNNLKAPVYAANLTSSGLSLPSSYAGVDVLIAGPPCQGFSTLGKRNIDDPRNDLLLSVGHITRTLMPKVVVIENVCGVIAGRHRDYWDQLKAELVNARYRTVDIKCDGTRMGVAQTRVRMIMVAWRMPKEIIIRLPVIPGGVLRDALSGIDGVPNHDIKFLKKGSPAAIIASHILPGKKLCNVRAGSRSVHTWDIPAVFGHTTPEEKDVLDIILRLRRRLRLREYGDADPVLISDISREYGTTSRALVYSLIRKGFVRKVEKRYDLTHTFNGKFRRLSWDQPSPTVDTRFGSPRYFLHPDDDRGFTVREAARIQGFPDKFLFLGSESDQYRLVGNAVPVPLAQLLASFIHESILN